PQDRHALAVTRRGEQPIDHLLVGVWRTIGEEGVNLGGRGRKAGQVERDTADQGRSVGLRRRGQSLALQPVANEGGNAVRPPAGVLHFREGLPPWRDQRPVFLPVGALLDPAADQLNLLGRQLAARAGRRHVLGRLVSRDALVDFALFGLPGDER